jgi:hypothetical protein
LFKEPFFVYEGVPKTPYYVCNRIDLKEILKESVRYTTRIPDNGGEPEYTCSE